MSEFYNDRLVAVTGATGLTGSYVVKALVDAGAKVRAITHQRPMNEFTRLAQEHIEANLENASSTREAVRGCEIVVHAAGVTGGIPLAVRDPSLSVTANAVMSVRVLDACAKERVGRFAFLSSSTVYPPTSKPVTEEQAWNGEPYETYFGVGWTKRYLEKLCKFYSDRYQLQVAIIRPSAVYGRYDSFAEDTSHIIPALIHRALAGARPFILWGDGGDVRDFLHASDLATGVLLATEKSSTCDPVNIASGESCSTMHLAKIVLNVVGSNAPIAVDSSKPAAIRSMQVDISKARRLLGFSPSVSLQGGIADTVKWYRERREN